MSSTLKLVSWGLVIAVIFVAFTIGVAQERKDDKKDDKKDDNKDVTKERQFKKVTKTAYVNLLKVIKEYEEWKKQLEELKNNKDRKQKKLNEDEKELNSLYKELKESVVPNPQKFADWTEKLKAYEFKKKWFEATLQRDFRKMFKEIYNEVFEAIETYAKVNKLDQVLGISEKKISVGTESEFFQKVSLRAVIYYHKENDITNDIIRLLGGSVEEDKEKKTDKTEKTEKTEAEKTGEEKKTAEKTK